MSLEADIEKWLVEFAKWKLPGPHEPPDWEKIAFIAGDKMLREELNELHAAVASQDRIEVIDAALDIIWEAAQLLFMCGVRDFDGFWTELCESNFSKLPSRDGQSKVEKGGGYKPPNFYQVFARYVAASKEGK